MPVHVYIPTAFRGATADAAKVDMDAPDVHTLLEALERRYEGLRGLVRDESGRIHQHVNVYVNNEEISALEGPATPLKDGDEVSIIPAIAGGDDHGWRPAARVDEPMREHEGRQLGLTPRVNNDPHPG